MRVWKIHPDSHLRRSINLKYWRDAARYSMALISHWLSQFYSVQQIRLKEPGWIIRCGIACLHLLLKLLQQLMHSLMMTIGLRLVSLERSERKTHDLLCYGKKFIVLTAPRFNISLSKRKLRFSICLTSVKKTQNLPLDLPLVHQYWDWFKILLVRIPRERVLLKKQINLLQLHLMV